MTEAELYLLFSEPIPGAVPSPLPEAIRRETIERSLWSPEEKAILRAHAAHYLMRFSLRSDPIEAFLTAYREAIRWPALVGIANPIAHTAHTVRWAQKIFSEGLEGIARETPPLHLWTGLLPVSVEIGLADLLAQRTATLWLRTAGYEQFGLPNLAHPLEDLRETGWVHSLFELLFDWMYFQKRPLQVGNAIEVPERGRYVVETFAPGVLALVEWQGEPEHG